MRAKTTLLATITAMLISLSIPIAMAQPPMPPCWFYGTVSVNGLPAQDNLNVTAIIRGTNLTSTTKTKNGTYGWTQRGSTSFYIEYDNLSTPYKDGGVDGDIIEFYVNGVKTNQTAIFEQLSSKRADLAVGSTHIPTNESTLEDNGDKGLTSNPYLSYITLAIVIGIGLVVVLWIHRKGYRIKVLRKPK